MESLVKISRSLKKFGTVTEGSRKLSNRLSVPPSFLTLEGAEIYEPSGGSKESKADASKEKQKQLDKEAVEALPQLISCKSSNLANVY
jgi:D-serine deaminase-like pyridoxal phosphate-dependent protein